MKAWLSRAGVPFTAHNVDEDARAYDALITRGFRAVPVTFVGEQAIAGYDVAALERAVAGWRAT